MGKTHTAWLLAGVYQERGKKLLVVDTDTQANITKSLLNPRRKTSANMTVPLWSKWLRVPSRSAARLDQGTWFAHRTTRRQHNRS